MSITVLYFASLKEKIGRDADQIPAEPGLTAAQIWQKLNPGIAMPLNTLIAANLEYISLDTPLNDGDELAFFPPVTGG